MAEHLPRGPERRRHGLHYAVISQHCRHASLVLCLGVCASMVIGGCSKRGAPQQLQQQPQETANQQKLRQDKRGD